jgi:hypothetical protein
MKILTFSKLFENSYYMMDQDSYEDIIYPNNIVPIHPLRNRPKEALKLAYKEQEDIINLLSEKYKVKESLDHSEFIDNEVVIGFNSVEESTSCWINFRFVKMYNKTNKHLRGRKETIDQIEVTISKFDDEWFYLRACGHKYNDYVKCDQIFGVLQYLKSKFI